MPLSPDAQRIYTHLIRKVLPTRHCITYSDLNRETGVPLGEAGGYVGRLLGEIFVGCDQQKLPPITSIIVRQD